LWIVVLACSPTGGPDGAENCPCTTDASSSPIIGDNSEGPAGESLTQRLDRLSVRTVAAADESASS
jgi:hypothetical protein